LLLSEHETLVLQTPQQGGQVLSPQQPLQLVLPLRTVVGEAL
jgi:hypothetical protein